MGKNFQVADPKYADFVYQPNVELELALGEGKAKVQGIYNTAEAMADSITPTTYDDWQGKQSELFNPVKGELMSALEAVRKNPSSPEANRRFKTAIGETKKSLTEGDVGMMQRSKYAYDKLREEQLKVIDKSTGNDKILAQERLDAWDTDWRSRVTKAAGSDDTPGTYTKGFDLRGPSGYLDTTKFLKDTQDPQQWQTVTPTSVRALGFDNYATGILTEKGYSVQNIAAKATNDLLDNASFKSQKAADLRYLQNRGDIPRVLKMDETGALVLKDGQVQYVDKENVTESEYIRSEAMLKGLNFSSQYNVTEKTLTEKTFKDEASSAYKTETARLNAKNDFENGKSPVVVQPITQNLYKSPKEILDIFTKLESNQARTPEQELQYQNYKNILYKDDVMQGIKKEFARADEGYWNAGDKAIIALLDWNGEDLTPEVQEYLIAASGQNKPYYLLNGIRFSQEEVDKGDYSYEVLAKRFTKDGKNLTQDDRANIRLMQDLIESGVKPKFGYSEMDVSKGSQGRALDKLKKTWETNKTSIDNTAKELYNHSVISTKTVPYVPNMGKDEMTPQNKLIKSISNGFTREPIDLDAEVTVYNADGQLRPSTSSGEFRQFQALATAAALNKDTPATITKITDLADEGYATLAYEYLPDRVVTYITLTPEGEKLYGEQEDGDTPKAARTIAISQEGTVNYPAMFENFVSPYLKGKASGQHNPQMAEVALGVIPFYKQTKTEFTHFKTDLNNNGGEYNGERFIDVPGQSNSDPMRLGLEQIQVQVYKKDKGVVTNIPDRVVTQYIANTYNASEYDSEPTEEGKEKSKMFSNSGNYVATGEVVNGKPIYKATPEAMKEGDFFYNSVEDVFINLFINNIQKYYPTLAEDELQDIITLEK